MEGFSNTMKYMCSFLIVNSAINSISSTRISHIQLITMDIFRIDELTDDMMNLSHDEFYRFLEAALSKDLCQLFRVQAIRDMSSLSNLTIDDITQVLNFSIISLNQLKESLGFVTIDGKFHLRLGFRNQLEHLLMLVKSKKNSRARNTELLNKQMGNDVYEKLTELLKRTSNGADVPILIPWMNNILRNSEKSKNKFNYDGHIQQFALLLLIFGGRNCYEFLRLNLPGALPHISNIELLIRKLEMRILEGEFRFQAMKEYVRSSGFNYVYVGEDSTSSLIHIDYDAQINSFIGFSSPLINGIPQPNYFQTDNFDELGRWFDEIEKSNFITLHMMKSIVPSIPPMILAAYGSHNEGTAIDVLKKWLFIYNKSSSEGVCVIGFSTDADGRYLRAMRLCSRLFAELPNLNLFKYNDPFDIKIPKHWTWFFMKEQQIMFFMQDPIHIATKFRNRLLSKVAKLKMGDYSISDQDLIDLIESKSKIEHNLVRCDVNPKDKQNYPSCLRISSQTVLNLLERDESAKGTYVYLSLLRLIISGLIEKSTKIEDRLLNIWTVVFTCRLWWSWIQQMELKDIRDNDLESIATIKLNSFITKPTFWCIEINAHTLLYIVLLVIKKRLPVEALNTFVFNSQICENTFRVARSLSGSFSSITNFSVKSFMKRCEKISIINSIKSRGGHVGDYRFHFPHHHKNDKETMNYSINLIQELNFNEHDVENIINTAYERAKNYVSMVNMSQRLIKKNLYSLPNLNSFLGRYLSKSSSKIVDYTGNDSSDDDNTDDESQNDGIDSQPFEHDQASPDGSDEEEEDGNVLASDLPDVAKKDFNGCRIYDRINLQHSNKYFRIRIGNSMKYLHKQTACWLLTTNKTRLSNDRLIRVRASRE